MKEIFKVVRWIIGIGLSLFSIGGFANKDYILAIIILSIGLLIIPPITTALFKKKNKNTKETYTEDNKKSAFDEDSKKRLSKRTEPIIKKEQTQNLVEELKIEIDTQELLNVVKHSNIQNRPNEMTIEDITGFFATDNKYSKNKEYCVSFCSGYYEGSRFKKGDLGLISGDKLLFKTKIARPHDCLVSNTGTVVCSDWLNSDSLSGKFLIYNKDGEQIFAKKTTANLGTCSISIDGQIAIFGTYGSNTNDGNKLFIIDVNKRKILKKLDKQYEFNSADIDSENQIIKLKNKGQVYEIDYNGNQTNKEEFEKWILENASIYDKLSFYLKKPTESLYNNTHYIDLLLKSIHDRDASHAFGKDKIYRMIGEYYEANGDIDSTIKYWQFAVKANPKVGISRRLDSLKNKTAAN